MEKCNRAFRRRWENDLDYNNIIVTFDKDRLLSQNWTRDLDEKKKNTLEN